MRDSSKKKQSCKSSSVQKTKVVVNSASQQDDSSSSTNNNRPRNFMVVDADTPLVYAFQGQYGIHTKITVHQTSKEDVWPGGAVWDLGWCMAQVIVSIVLHNNNNTMASTITNNKKNHPTSSSNSSNTTTGVPPKTIIRNLTIPNQLSTELIHRIQQSTLILELGCGVGLTGLVASAVIQPKIATILTDLDVVIEKVTQENVKLNTKEIKRRGETIHMLHQSQVYAIPLCWGNVNDELSVQTLIDELTTKHQQQQSSPKMKKKKKKNKNDVEEDDDMSNNNNKPDLILIGDVAYQHRPGAISHFDVLISTLLKFISDKTIVIFGTRIRMPASNDLLDMMLQHFDEIIPSITADDINPTDFNNIKHNMTIHFLQMKK